MFVNKKPPLGAKVGTFLEILLKCPRKEGKNRYAHYWDALQKLSSEEDSGKNHDSQRFLSFEMFDIFCCLSAFNLLILFRYCPKVFHFCYVVVGIHFKFLIF